MREKFRLLHTDAHTRARLGELRTAHGVFRTPVFMPVGTRAAVKAVSPHELKEIGAEIILANTYHLFLRPGEKIIRDAGGIPKEWKNSSIFRIPISMALSSSVS